MSKPNVKCTLQNKLYFVNIYKNITDINVPFVTYTSTLYRCNRTKTDTKSLLLCGVAGSGAPVSGELQQH